MGYNKTIIAHIGGKYVGTTPPANKDLIWFDKNLTSANRVKYYNEANSTWESFMGSVGITESLNGTPNAIPYFNSDGDFTTGLNLSYNNTTKETFLTKLKLSETDDSMNITTTGFNQKLKIGSPHGLIHESFGSGDYLSDRIAYLLGVDSNGVQKEVNVSDLKNIWFNEDGTIATQSSTHIKYDRGNVTIGTGGLANDYFSVIPKSTFVQDNILNNASITVGLRTKATLSLNTAIDNSIGAKTIFGVYRTLTFNDSSQVEHPRLAVAGESSVVEWLSPSPLRYLGNAGLIRYRGKDIGSTINSTIVNHNGTAELQAIDNSVQTSALIYARAFVASNYLNAVNTIQNITSLYQSSIDLSFSFTRNNIINITNLEQFSNSAGLRFNANGVGSSINITNLYGLRLITPTTYLNTNVINNYGISQEWSSAKNYFAGNVGIGTNNPSVGLDLVGHFKQPSGYIHYLGDSSIFDVDNNLYLRASVYGNNIFVSNISDTNLYNFNIKANTTDLTGRLVVGMHPIPYWNALFKDYSDNSGIYISSVSAGGGKYIAGNSYYFNGQQWRSDKNGSSIINLDNGNIVFYTNSGLTPNSDFTPTGRVLIDYLGNMGIGTLQPTNALHLIGRARLESYVSNSYDSKNPAKTLGINSTGEVVSIVNQNINNYATITQTNHGYTTITPLRFDINTGIFVPASATSESLLATTVFLKAENVNTMILGVSCMFELAAHGFVVGGKYYTNPYGTGVVLEDDLPSGLAANRTQLVFTVLSSDVIQINLQNHVH